MYSYESKTHLKDKMKLQLKNFKRLTTNHLKYKSTEFAILIFLSDQF